MDENEVRERFARLSAAMASGQEPDELDVLALVEGALVNLARLANRRGIITPDEVRAQLHPQG